MINQEALDRHYASPMMQEFLELCEKYNLTMEVERYITDESGIPEGDLTLICEERNSTDEKTNVTIKSNAPVTVEIIWGDNKEVLDIK